MARKRVPPDVEMKVLTSSRRRCCLCFWLDGIEHRVKGQIAHLDQNAENSDFGNLAFLCLGHHDEYDGRTSVSKGLQESEVRHYRDRLYRELDLDAEPCEPRINNPDIDAPPTFMDYLDGLSGDELFRLVKPVFVSQSQSINCPRHETVTAMLVSKGFLEPVTFRATLQEFASNAEMPHTIPPAAWRYLNDNQEWLLDAAIKKNADRSDRMPELARIREALPQKAQPDISRQIGYVRESLLHFAAVAPTNPVAAEYEVMLWFSGANEYLTDRIVKQRRMPFTVYANNGHHTVIQGVAMLRSLADDLKPDDLL